MNLVYSMKRKLSYCLLFLFICQSASGQWHQVFSPDIFSLRVVKNRDASLFPLLDLRGSDVVEISFDHVTHIYNRFTYKVIHCDADWEPTESLFEPDYIEGTNDENIIEQYNQSMATTVLYTHYTFSLPNHHIRFKISGNYRVEIYGENSEEEPVAEIRICVADSKFGLQATMRTNTDISNNTVHQQLEYSLLFGKERVVSPQREIKTVVLQNRRRDNCKRNIPASFVTGNGMEWRNQRELIFLGGNEYRKFEILDVHMATLGVEKLNWFAPYYHAELQVTRPGRNYIYQEDQDGRFYIRSSGNGNDDTESDYIVVHYSLSAPKRNDGDYYVEGDATYHQFSPRYRMRYDADSQCYVADILQKQGYYNYQYLFVPKGFPEKGMTESVEGDYYQTENEYAILVYYHPQGSRYDQLAGYRIMRFAPKQ